MPFNVSSQLAGEELDIRCPFCSLTAKFRVKKRLFGAVVECYYQAAFSAGGALHIKDAAWTGSWQGGKLVFNSRRRPIPAPLRSVNDDTAVQSLLQEAGVKKVEVGYRYDGESRDGCWSINLYPLAGVIAVVYFPPVFPLEVSLQTGEIQKQYRFLERMVDVIKTESARKNVAPEVVEALHY